MKQSVPFNRRVKFYVGNSVSKLNAKISDYALIGNSRAAALVSKYGSIDWCCMPEFDSPSIFAALLDPAVGGYFCIAPITPFQSVHEFVPDTNVVRTRFTTQSTAEVCCYDAFVALTENEKRNSLFPDHEILRVVDGVKDRVRLKVEYVPKLLFGKSTPVLKNKGSFGFQFTFGENCYCLVSTLSSEVWRVTNDNHLVAEFDVGPGDRVIFSLSCGNQSPGVIPELRQTAWTRLANTLEYWRNWISKIRYNGMYSQEVKRSALALKLLTHAPSGSIIAAPTTSLPEIIGGERNWDYRYCWLRDASFTVRALLRLGFEEEAHAYMNWILHATRLTRPRLQVVYSTYGHASLSEETLHWLSGYQGSAPVRIKNNADDQFQLDVYGEVLDAVYTYSSHVRAFDRDSRRFIIGLGKVISKEWNQPDNGIWEMRHSLQHHTHSKVMCWVGLDRLIKLSKKYGWSEVPIEKLSNTASHIRNEIEKQGYNDQLGSYTQTFGGSSVDASALTFSLVGYADPSSPRMVSTIKTICARLEKNKLIYRYLAPDGLEGREGCFGICSFWLAENLAGSGNVEEAIDVFDSGLRYSGATGLLSEEFDPHSLELLGNYPQGFTHIGLINAALAIDLASQTPKVSTKKHEQT